MITDSDYPFGIFKLFFDIDLRFANGWTEIAKIDNNTGLFEAFASLQ